MITSRYSIVQRLSLAALAAGALLSSLPAHADITTYRDQGAYLAAVGTTGVDTFDDLTFAPVVTPLDRMAGAFGYRADIVGSQEAWAGSDDNVDIWLTTGSAADTITFTNFDGNVAGAGGYFFGTDPIGFSTPSAQITITATDSAGMTVTQVIDAPTPGSFMGFVSSARLTSLSVFMGSVPLDAFPTVNNLQLSAPVPEPATYGMLLAGLGLLGWAARRRQR